MDPAFLRGFQIGVRRQPIVFRQRLKPLTLGHLFLLEAIESPLIGQREAPLSFSDIGAAVFVCAHDHETSRRKFQSWTFPIFVRIWSWFATGDWIARDWPVFRDYLQDGLGSPMIRPIQREEGTTGVCSSPAAWVKLLFAMHILGMSRAEAMRTQIVELNTLYATWAEWSGRAELVDGGAIAELWEFARQQDEKKRQQQEAG